MQKNYKILCCAILFLIPSFCFGQYGVGIDTEMFKIVNSNFAVRLVGESTAQNTANNIKKNLDRVNENYAKLIAAKAIVDDALCNVNSALKNALAIKEMANTTQGIYLNIAALWSIGVKYPHYSHLTKKYVEDAFAQAVALQGEVTNIALKGSEKNIVMNYNQRDQLIRDVYIRLRLILSDLQLARMSIEQAVSLGWFKGATPFGQWVSNDKQIVEQTIAQAKSIYQ